MNNKATATMKRKEDFFIRDMSTNGIIVTFVLPFKIKFKTKKYFSVKHSGLIFIVLLMISVMSFRSPDPFQQHSKVTRIVIDAGHGGHDPGAVGKKSKEKDIVLEVALLTGKMITTFCPGVEVIYTRDTDVFVELYKRAKIANDNKADLFISIHCNASPKSEPKGTEVYVMGLDKSEQNLEIAKKENASILLEEDYEAKYEGIDPNSSEAYIAFSIFQHAFLDQSLLMATKTMAAFTTHLGLTSRGIKQAPFLVLWRTTMPSILIEIGFISNPTEEEFLMKDDNKKKVAYSIYKAFVLYKNEVEGTALVPVDFLKATGFKTELPKDTVIKSGGDQVKKDTVSAEIHVENIRFCVQLFIDPELLPAGHSKFKGAQNVFNYLDGGYYKYYVGTCKSFAEAAELQKTMRNTGFPEAFVIAMNGDKRMDIKIARQLTEK
jgi:N-acetylmuramoyl-L-alanine amidase